MKKLSGLFWTGALAFSLSVAGATPASASVVVEYYGLAPFDDAGPTNPNYKWGAPVYGTPGGLVTYSFIAAGTDCSISGAFAGIPCATTADLNTVLGAGYQGVIANAFNQWQSVANIQFSQVADSGAPAGSPAPGGFVGDIRIGAYNMGNNGILAYNFYPYSADDSAGINSWRGDMMFNSFYGWESINDGTGDGAYNFGFVALHELGHAIGLSHEGQILAVMNPFYTEAITGLQADDIAGARFIYGREQTPPPAPEPASLTLLGLGLAAALRRRFTQKG